MIRTRKQHSILALLLFFCSAHTGFAAESFVEQYFSHLRSLSAWFVQTVVDENGNVIQVSSGRMLMVKPSRFRWDYKDPFAQTIVADGEHIWLYDHDLEQVTVRRMQEALSSAPLALLSGVAPIEQTFRVTESVDRAGLRWFELQPLQQQSEYQRLRVAFAEQTLVSIELEDALKQTTRLRLEALKTNIDIDASEFVFTPPEGVDVVGDL